MKQADILRALQNSSFPFERRKSVRHSNSDNKRGFILGTILDYYKNRYTVTKQTKKKQHLTKLLCAWIRKHHPSFYFTTIQVNKGGSALHVDSINCGPSIIQAFGKFTGGKLWSLDKPSKSASVRSLTWMDGNVPHITLPFKGERYSVVYFALKPRDSPPPTAEQQKFLRSLGFPAFKRNLRCPLSKAVLEAGSTPKERLSKAANILKKLRVPGIGDYTNKSISYRGR